MHADDVEIPHLCSIDLRERIAGASAQFHCDHCDRSVHVLSHMSEADAARILARRQRDNLCVAFLRGPDGRVHFRGEGETLVPASRLAGPRMMLRVSALALGVAGCTFEHDPIELVEAFGGAPPHAVRIETETEGNSTRPEATHAQSEERHMDERHMEERDGAPPAGGETPAREPDDAAKTAPGLHVPFEALRPRSNQPPSRRALLATRAGRVGGLQVIELEYCVDKTGDVNDTKHVRGDRELAHLYIEAARHWNFTPHEFESQRVRVCTTQIIVVDLDGDEPA